MPPLPVVLSVFANNPDQVYLDQLEAERDHLQAIFRTRRDLRHEILPNGNSQHFIDTLQDYSNELQIFHFGGHANGQKVTLTDVDGNSIGLAKLLSTCTNLKLIVLNGCDTQDQAEAYLNLGVPAVIATTCPVKDGQAMQFAKYLYRALVNHQSIESAFKQAVGAIEFRATTALDETIIRYRGIVRAKIDNKAPWILHLNQECEEEIKTWKLEDPERLTRLMAFYSAIKGRPKGVRFLDQYFPKEVAATKYQYFLSEGILPYYSLDAFHLEKEVDEPFYSEIKLIDTLLNGAHFEGGIISGKGGVGKTRLMLQLGILAHEAGWNVLVLNHRFDDEAALGAFLDSLENKKHLILIDYLEECPWFNDSFLDEVKTHCQAEKIRFLANCRNSFPRPKIFKYLNIQLDEIPYPKLKEYEHWVITQILEGFEGLDLTKVKKASFAVFLRYLRELHPGEPQNILLFDDFRTWLLKRFISTIDSKRHAITEFEQEIAWLLSFPMEDEAKQTYFDTGSDFKITFENLIKDGWIESDEKGRIRQWKIVQDTVLDELALAYLSEYSDKKKELKNLLRYSVGQKRARSWINNLQRLTNELQVNGNEKLFFQLFKDVLPLQPDLVPELFGSSLLSEDEFLELAKSTSGIAGEAARIRLLYLSFDMNRLAKGPGFDQDTRLVKLVHAWMAIHPPELLHAKILARFISAYLKFVGLDEKITPFIDQFWDLEIIPESSFVLQEYLERCQSIASKVQDYFQKYLVQYSFNKGFENLIRAWLDRGGDTEVVQGVLEWFLEKNPGVPNSRGLIFSWLKAGGKFQVVDQACQRLVQHQTSRQGSYIIEDWWKITRDINSTAALIQLYLKHHNDVVSSAFMLKNWLLWSKDPEPSQSYVVQYLQNNYHLPEAQILLQAWLKVDGKIEPIEQVTLQSLENQPLHKDVHYLIREWLKQGRGPHKIKDKVKQYLSTFAPDANYRRVLEAWLEAGGEHEFIATSVQLYLKQNSGSIDLSFLIDVWLKKGGDSKLVEKPSKLFLQGHGHHRNASFVLSAWLNRRQSPDFIVDRTKNYLSKNASSLDARYVFKAWLGQNVNSPDVIFPYLTKFLNKHGQSIYADEVIIAWISQGYSIRQIINEKLAQKILQLCRNWLERNRSNPFYQQIDSEYKAIKSK